MMGYQYFEPIPENATNRLSIPSSMRYRPIIQPIETMVIHGFMMRSTPRSSPMMFIAREQ